MIKRPYAFVCAPFKGNNPLLVEKCREYSRQLYEAGYMPICPSLLFPQFMSMSAPQERKAIMEMSQNLLRRSNIFVVCGNIISDAMLCDIMLATRLHIPTTSLNGIMAVYQHSQSPQAENNKPH